MSKPRWLPLESNPDVMNQYISNLGVDTKNWQYFDVFGLDPDLLMMIPQPVCSLLLLFPITENYEKFKSEEEANIKANGQLLSENLYFTTQTVGNACGTVGIIHSIANNINQIELKEGPLMSFLEKTKTLLPDDKAKALETDIGIMNCHKESALEGQTKAPSVDEKVNLHFVAFVEHEGQLYELDGRKPFPINHGDSSPETMLNDAAKICQKFMKRDPDLLQFNMVALAKRSDF